MHQVGEGRLCVADKAAGGNGFSKDEWNWPGWSSQLERGSEGGERWCKLSSGQWSVFAALKDNGALSGVSGGQLISPGFDSCSLLGDGDVPCRYWVRYGAAW